MPVSARQINEIKDKLKVHGKYFEIEIYKESDLTRMLHLQHGKKPYPGQGQKNL